MVDFDQWNKDQRQAYAGQLIGTVIGGLIHLIELDDLRQIVKDFAENDYIWGLLRKAVINKDKAIDFTESMKDLILKFANEPNLKLVSVEEPNE